MDTNLNVRSRVAQISGKRMVAIALLGWLSMLGFDFFLHAGLLARLYLEPSPFLLPSEEAFKLIPLGYLSFVPLTVLLLWLMATLGIALWWAGLRAGLILGATVWGSLILGLWSVSTADRSLLLGWFLGQTVELGIAGAVMGSGLARSRLRGLVLKVLGLVLFLAVITVVLQSLGLAPANHL